jgi:hypothetical protein
MPTRSDGADGVAAGCGDTERRERRLPVRVGGWESGGQVEEWVQEVAHVLSYEQATAAFPV